MPEPRTFYGPVNFNQQVTFRSTVTVPAASIAGSKLTTKAAKKTCRTVWFNLDNGSGTTVDDVAMRPTTAITLIAARIVYVDATTGTVAAGTASVGTTVGGVDLVAATAYENAKAVGATTAMVLALAAVAAGTPICVRHTGVASTQAGQAVVELDYTVDD